jgi:hypothetical protein
VRLHLFGKLSDDPTGKLQLSGALLNAPTLRMSLFDIAGQTPKGAVDGTARVPNVAVTLEHTFGKAGGYRLLVVNLGSIATLRANMHVVSSDFGFAGSRHDLWWERAGSVESRIATNGEDHLVFGKIQIDHKMAPPLVTPSLHISYNRRQPTDLVV